VDWEELQPDRKKGWGGGIDSPGRRGGGRLVALCGAVDSSR
jgi:hypothetical protein